MFFLVDDGEAGTESDGFFQGAFLYRKSVARWNWLAGRPRPKTSH